MNLRMLVCFLLILLLLASCRGKQADESSVKTEPANTAMMPQQYNKPKPDKIPEKRPARDIQGFRAGMGMNEVKQVLRGKGITKYETGFSDMFIYSPSFGVEIKLQFTCGTKELVLSNVKLSTTFPVSDADRAIAVCWDKLTAKYGPPARSDAGPGSMSLCWGDCEQKGAWRLEAITSSLEKGNVPLEIALTDGSLVRECEEKRHGKIDRWLNRWIDDVSKFSTGISHKHAAEIYMKRYHDPLVVSEERDEKAVKYAVMNLVATGHDYFVGLDYESLYFEGAGPGSIILKFTGDQADPKSKLNKRLYYALFTTTSFGNKRRFPDVRKKLYRFVRFYGTPVEVSQVADGLTALWESGSSRIKAGIFESGLITFEQADDGIRDAYREAAEKNLEEIIRTRFDKALF